MASISSAVPRTITSIGVFDPEARCCCTLLESRACDCAQTALPGINRTVSANRDRAKALRHRYEALSCEYLNPTNNDRRRFAYMPSARQVLGPHDRQKGSSLSSSGKVS